MNIILRSPQIVSGHYNILKYCHKCHHNLQYVCLTNIKLAPHDYSIMKRLLSTTRPTVNVLFNNIESHQMILYIPPKHLTLTRNINLSCINYDKEPLKPSSKVEVTVHELKKKKGEQPKELVPKAPEKKSLKQKVIDELMHYYHGFRLLFIDMKISTVLVWRVLNGKSLSRREHRLLIRTVGDMFRLVPFSVFIIVPFMEFLLPVFIKFFPGMLPSTFQTATDKEDKIKQNFKVKLEMAKFLQKTLDEMAVQHKDHKSQDAKEFAEWFQKVRTSGEQVTNEEIMKFSKLFEDEITLDSLSRSQLVALCRVVEVQTLGTNNILRFQLRMKLRNLAADDKMIQKEGIDSLTLPEVQQACRVRGMRAYGVSEARLRNQLSQWLDLSLNEKVPPSLLLLSRALMLPETIPTGDRLKATIFALPDTVVTQTKAAIGEKEGKIDNKVKIEVLKEEERKIKEERREEERKKEEEEKKKEEEERDKEVLVDKAPTISAKDTPEIRDKGKIVVVKPEKITPVDKKEERLIAKDLEALEDALDSISKEKFIVEKEEIEELKEQMADYHEDVQDLHKAVAEQPKPEIKETKAAQRLYKKVNKMIGKMDSVLVELQDKEHQLKEAIETEASADKKKEELLKIDDIIHAIKKIKNVPDEYRIEQIKHVLGKMDDDCDGSIKVEDVLKVIEFIGKENVKLSAKQVDELIDLLDKEEILEVEDKIEKALQKEKDAIETKQDSKNLPPPPPSSSSSGTPPSSSTGGTTSPPPSSSGESKPPEKSASNKEQQQQQQKGTPTIETKQFVATPPSTSIEQSKDKLL